MLYFHNLGQYTNCSDKVADFECICKKGFKGKKCEINIDECKPNPCYPGQSINCTDLIDDFNVSMIDIIFLQLLYIIKAFSFIIYV